MTRTRATEIGLDLAIAFVPLVAVTQATRWRFDLPASYLLQTIVFYILLAALVARRAPRDLPARGDGAGGGLGPANRVTLGRVSLVLPVAALSAQPAIHTASGYWWVIAVSTVALMLDAVDGWVARRSGSASAFGARLDMELDAFLLLALSVLVWRSGKMGAWVVLIGTLRYLFVVAGWLWPALQAELPESLRRKTVCVIQGIALLFCLGPVIPATAATAIASGALASLFYSFGVDTRWLITTQAPGKRP